MKKITNSVRSEFGRNSAKLLSSNAIAQIIGLLIYPILSRLYSPDDFGLVNLFLSIGGVITLFATAEYQYAIMLPKSEHKAAACFHIGFFITLGVTLLCLLTVPFATSIANLFNAPTLSNWYFLLPIFVFVSALWILLNYWYTRHKKFTNISTYQLTQSLFGAGSKYGFGLIGFTSGGLILSTILAPVLSLIISISTALKKTLKPLLRVDKAACKKAANEYANFPKYALPRSIINNLSGNLPVLLLTPFFGLTEIGFFGMALTLAFRPINMISSSLYQVFFQRTAEHVQNKQSILPFFKKFIQKTVLIITPTFAVLYFILPWLTAWLLGDSWEVTGDYIRIMLPWLALVLISSAINYLPDIFGKQYIYMYIEILYIILRATSLVIGIITNNIQIALTLYFTISTIILLIEIVWFLGMVKKYEKKLIV